MNGMRVAAVGLAALVLAGFAAAAGYNAGWTRGSVEAVQALPVAAGEAAPGTVGPSTAVYGPGPYPYGYGWRGYWWGPGGWHGGWAPFGFLFPLFGFLFFFLFLKLVLFGFWGGRHRGEGRWERARRQHDEWHRSTDGPASSGGAGGAGGPSAGSAAS